MARRGDRSGEPVIGGQAGDRRAGPPSRAVAAVIAGVLTVVWLGLVWLVLPAPTASAHAYLLASTPPDGYALPIQPAAVTLDFDEPVTIGVAALIMSDRAGKPYPLGPASLSLAGRRLSAPLATRLDQGGYRIRWEVTVDDGDLVSGVISFAVGTATALPPTPVSASVDSPLVVAARWVLFAGLALALGGLVGDGLTRRVVHEADRVPDTTVQTGLPRPAVIPGAILGMLAALVLAAGQVGLDPTQLGRAGPGRVPLTELGGFALALVVEIVLTPTLTRRHARAQPRTPAMASRASWTVAIGRGVGSAPPTRAVLTRALAGVPLLAVVAAEGWRAHPHTASPVWGTALTLAHLVAGSVWIGALIHVLRVARNWRHHDGRGLTRLLVYDYSRLALVLVGLVVVTGTLDAVIMLPTPAALLATPYGLVLVAKLAGVLLVLGFAGAARRRLRRSITAPTVTALGRTARAEALGLLSVLGIAALLVSTAPPRPATDTLAAAPPPIGPTVPAGTLAGYTTVIATASAGQLLLRMTVPGRDDLGTTNTTGRGGTSGQPSPDYRISARVSTPEGAPRTLTPRRCGPGCFTSPVDWRDGTNQVHLDISAPPWPAATAVLDIPWPPHPDTATLPRTLAVMRAIPTMTVHQAVTSNYTGDPGPEIPLRFSGTDYLSAEPYKTGGGNPIALPAGPGVTELRLAFPQGIAIRLLLDQDSRILREEETTPNHLVTTTFEYPPASR
ncbi:MAG: copper resistance protein CopC [Actinomycetota bacterium]|nr:copper resistance protein CopC [Actinomycetota bacterium]